MASDKDKDKDKVTELYTGRHRKDGPKVSREELERENKKKTGPKSRFRIEYLDED